MRPALFLPDKNALMQEQLAENLRIRFHEFVAESHQYDGGNEQGVHILAPLGSTLVLAKKVHV